MGSGEGHGALERDARPTASLRRVAPGDDGDVRVIRTAVPISSLTEHLLRLGAPLATARHRGDHRPGVAWLLSGAMRRRIDRMVRAPPRSPPARRRSVPSADSIGVLESRLGDMARDVQTTLAAMRVERERLEAILRGMVEGVLSPTSTAGSCCRTRARSSRSPARAHRGRAPSSSISCAIPASPNPAPARQRAAGGLAWRLIDRLSLQVNGARLTAETGHTVRPGARAARRRAASSRTVRRDFVNVSHELRTPLTAIKDTPRRCSGRRARVARRRSGSSGDRPSFRAPRPPDQRPAHPLRPRVRAHAAALRAIAIHPVIDDVIQICTIGLSSGG